MDATAPILQALEKLIAVVAQLRSPEGGCPWDLAQTQQSLIPYVVEEAYEVVHALQGQDQTAIAEELGDLLLQVVLQAQVAQDLGHFNLQQVAEGITAKLIRRHPHVFAEVTVSNAEEVKANWQAIKAEEKGLSPDQPELLSSKLERYNSTLPPLMASSKISQKAAAVGFEWPDIEGVWAKFNEELTEFKQALATTDKEHQQAELGDLLFTLINLARWYKLDASLALHGTNQRFIQRLQLMEKFADRPLDKYNLEALETLWQRAKKQLNQ
ncbi:nucleoside triphosphate pyrophosphohydrolase [Synechocystis salina]|uniref:Nucleoside triphosphate pyrophosphohydrolase n=1 Tax=Synechocystis salina LEGE 00031 TaxID=1828736 RepID=A0ABR9VMT8_9SYNC|nr:nucleoside triphosphate pyrophosphohydrolase [Synechocystis salina]MBE9239620.1 nucleoside triphosphate pyrophosphohydrolase [Synechocystis salina LEGE 00041]MBE9252659.1 nucleoside triphosphate pyrophosphohydrolase [Synechocystis salina LEGE 00031]